MIFSGGVKLDVSPAALIPYKLKYRPLGIRFALYNGMIECDGF
jgi:hypothetical protein